MKRNTKLTAIIMVLAIILQIFSANIVFADEASADSKIKNIIFMIPDGGGMTAFNMADAVKQAGGFNDGVFPNATPVEKGEMNIKPYWVGAETTKSANADITDSAAAGTALATGNKTFNGYVGIDSKAVPVANLLEASQYVGKNTGLVVTYEWTNATPAAFSAHDISRVNAMVIAEQIANQGIDVVLGSSISAYDSASYLTDEALTNKGYEIMKSDVDLAGVEPGDKLWGKFSGKLNYDVSPRTDDIPTLAEMTDAAITALNDDNENGFFLMVEGSAVDGGGHSNDASYMVGDFMAFDAACKIAIDFAKQRDDTIVLVAPDHDTGGMNWDEANLSSIVSQLQAGTAKPTDLKWTSTGHTNWDGGIFIYAPEGVSYPEGIDPSKAEIALNEFASTGYQTATTNRIDNTDIPKYLAKFIGVDLDELSQKLFVDVTDMGNYNTEVFTFDSFDIQIKRNESVAKSNGSEIDLNGEVALYIKNRFYVPESLLYNYAMGGMTGSYVDVSNKGTYDEETQIFTFNDYDAYIKNYSHILVLGQEQIHLGKGAGVLSDGKFLVPSKVLEALERFTSEENASVEIVADYNSKLLDVSGWIGAANKVVSVLAVTEGTERTNDGLNSNNILWLDNITADYSGDFSFTIPVEAEDIDNKYTFYMNYTDSSNSTPISRDFVFQNVIPEILVKDDAGAEIMYMDQLNAGDSVNVTLRGFDNEASFKGMLAIAQYDEKDALKDVALFDANGSSVEVGSEVKENTVVLAGTKTIKIMYWNNTNMAPVFGVLTIPSK